MTRKPRLLDLGCKAGGCSYGYHLAGFEVVGVDIEPQKNYPFEFILGDMLTISLDGFDAYHASPHCQGYTILNNTTKDRYPLLIGPIRERFLATGKPYIIENVENARWDMRDPLMLCASMFGLPMKRHRLFESNIHLTQPRVCDHSIATIGVYGHSIWDFSKEGTPRKDGRRRPDSVPVDVGRAAMGIPWMSKGELAQAIPPVYTEWLGQQMMKAILNAYEHVA